MMMIETKTEADVKLWLGLVIAVAIIIRLVLLVTYPPVSFSDTASYRRSADAILGGFQAYDGTRTPGYPAFMALMGPDSTVYVSQLVLGLAITLAWFFIGFKSSGSPLLGALAGLAHTLNPGQFFFEANLLTETLSTFWLVLALLGSFLWLENNKFRSIWMALGIGISAALATLTRPLFIFMPVWLAVFLAFSFKDKKRQVSWKPILGVLLPAVLLVGGWMRWIQSNYHVFSLTTMSGYHLVQHTGYYFEDVPDEYADLRDVYLEYRAERIADRGTQGNTIWDAIPAMQAATGMNFYELSRTLQEVSIQLIITHPLAYLLRVLRGWWYFWRAPIYWDISAVSSAFVARVLHGFNLIARGLIFMINLAFIITTIAAMVSRRLRDIWALRPFMWLLAGSVWATSVLSSLLDHGDNPRFLVPLQTAVVFWVIWVTVHAWQTWQKSQKDKQEIMP